MTSSSRNGVACCLGPGGWWPPGVCTPPGGRGSRPSVLAGRRRGQEASRGPSRLRRSSAVEQDAVRPNGRTSYHQEPVFVRIWEVPWWYVVRRVSGIFIQVRMDQPQMLILTSSFFLTNLTQILRRESHAVTTVTRRHGKVQRPPHLCVQASCLRASTTIRPGRLYF